VASSTTSAQRIGIWIIVVALSIGTLASFAAIIFSNQNQATDETSLNDAYADYQSDLQKQANELSGVYYEEFNGYASRVGTFDKASVTELKTEDLKVGDGAEVTTDSSYAAYYIGWNPEGKIFDQSIADGKLKNPLDVTPSTSLISGWTTGMQGMKIGGVREITIPSDLAYGESGQGEDIPANTPLKFIVMAVPTPEEVPVPKVLQDYYNSLNQQQ